MIITVSDYSDEPLQAQISRQLRAKILSGDMEPGEPLPSIRGLARQVKVSVITVQRAYESLQQEELIHSRRGKGFFVAQFSGNQKEELAAEALREKLEGTIQSALAEGLDKERIIEIVNRILNGAEG